MKKLFLLTVLMLCLSAVAFAHSPINRFWGEVPVDMLLTGDVLVVKPLIVPEGVTLTIDPGTIVRFEKSAKADNGIVVRGTLVAAGTREKPIRFIPKDAASGPWRGIEFQGAGRGRVEYCSFEKASGAIMDPGKKAEVKGVSFR